ncbi:MAG TPA: phosphoenolpyruvate hydrolase family protein [Acetobacteraceae bacterium]|nr:phosphoenolpyruvate hydrolase family protein [Acetobacteraceae bacterium]
MAFWIGGLAWHDANAELLAAIGTPNPHRHRVYAGVFCVDPFRRDADLFAALRMAGIDGVVNLPTVSVIDAELGGILGSFNLGIDRELAFLRRAGEAGFRIAGCVATVEAADQLVAFGADVIIAHGGPPQPGLSDPSNAVAGRLRQRFASGPPIVSAADLLATAPHRMTRRTHPLPARPTPARNRR